MKGIPLMKCRLVGFWTLCCVFALIASFKVSRKTYSQAKKTSSLNALSQAEQDLLNEINQARAHPQTYVAYLEKLKPLFNGKEYKPSGQDSFATQECWSAV